MNKEHTKQTQADRVLARLKRGPLTALDAMLELGVMRLAARIHELKERDGIEIVSSTAEVENRWGEKVKIAQYSIEHECVWVSTGDAWGSQACETCGTITTKPTATTTQGATNV